MLLDGERGKEHVVLRAEAEAPADPLDAGVDVVAVHDSRAGGGGEQAWGREQERLFRFPCL